MTRFVNLFNVQIMFKKILFPTPTFLLPPSLTFPFYPAINLSYFLPLLLSLSFPSHAQDLIPYLAKNGLYGYAEEATGKVVVEPKYKYAPFFSEYVVILNKKVHFSDFKKYAKKGICKNTKGIQVL
ncbi:MAG: hypothetical protein RLZZ292_3661 [Bacteroidota bacterium]|jgi:hypothetical protein